MVYFVQSVKYVKIGFSKEPWMRIEQLQAANPEKLYDLGYICGDQFEEAMLHEMFAKYHKHGEWFYLTREIADFIKLFAVSDMYAIRKQESVLGYRHVDVDTKTKIVTYCDKYKHDPQQLLIIFTGLCRAA